MIKKGQLRRWCNPRDGGIFMTIGCRIHRGGDRRSELGWAAANRGRKIWTILEEGGLTEETHIDLEQHTEAIDEVG